MKSSNTYEKELDASNQITDGNILKVLISILLPIFFYGLLNYSYDFFDTFVISVSRIGTVESVFVLTQIKKMIATFGAGIITGALILIAQKMGAKQFETAKKYLYITFISVVVLSVIFIVLLIPFAPPSEKEV